MLIEITPVFESKVIPELIDPDIDRTRDPVPYVEVNADVLIGIVIVVAIVEGPETTTAGLTIICRATFVTEPTESVTVTDSLKVPAFTVVESIVTTPVDELIEIPA